MRILFLSHDKSILQDGSVSQRRMQEYGKFCDGLWVIVTTPKGFTEKRIGPNIRIIPTDSWNRFFYVCDMARIASRLVRQDRIDLVSSQDPFEFGVIGVWLKWWHGVRLQIQEHGDFYSHPWWRRESMMNRIRALIGRWVLRRADGIRVVSKRIERALIAMGIALKKISTVSVFVDIERFFAADATLRKSSGGAFTILAMGRLVPQKNVPLLLEAFSDIASRYSDARLRIVGKGAERRDLEVLARRLNIVHRVEFTEWTEDPAAEYRACDLYVLPSNYEGWPRAIAEAMASRLPIIMTDMGSAGEFLINEMNGLVVPVGDRAALARALSRMIKDDPLRERLGRAAFETASAYSKESHIQQFVESWKACLPNKVP
ncbi:MAG: glycosyltransferase family 4 protein [bacterium]|nr:glycosyltransferase family 4 protein [bacterium]